MRKYESKKDFERKDFHTSNINSQSYSLHAEASQRACPSARTQPQQQQAVHWASEWGHVHTNPGKYKNAHSQCKQSLSTLSFSYPFRNGLPPRSTLKWFWLFDYSCAEGLRFTQVSVDRAWEVTRWRQVRKGLPTFLGLRRKRREKWNMELLFITDQKCPCKRGYWNSWSD